MNLSSSTIRNEFPQTSRKIGDYDLIYFDNAASTLKHQDVIKSINEHYSHNASNIHRGVHTLSESGTRQFEETRECVRDFINAPSCEEIIFTKGTTESLNLVANSWGEISLKPNDVILLSTMEHHSNIVPWQLIAQKKGAKIEEIPLDQEGRIIEEKFLELLKNKNVKMISMAHVSNTLGTINPIKKFIRQTREFAPQAFFTVDAAQSAAHLKIDVQELDCDFLAFSAHKTFGPSGVGVLFGKKKILEHMPPYQGGGDMIDQVSLKKTTYNDLPHKFEAGTPHIAGVIALKAAINFINREGIEKLASHESLLLEYATTKLKELPQVTILGPRQLSEKSAVISFTLQGAHPHDLGTLLDQQGIAIRTGHHCTQPLMEHLKVTSTARISFGPYNNTDEINRFYHGLIKAYELL